uniref:RNA polymerase II-associated protein 3 n=1 Tax=Culicoides sonorensis TaxID=179676 RepID=A0A336LNP0_CULSO
MAKDALETQQLIKNNCEDVTQQLKKLRVWQKEIKQKEKIVKMDNEIPSTSSYNHGDKNHRDEHPIDHDLKVKRSKTVGDFSDNPEPMEELNEEEMKQEADIYKQKGNNYVKLQDYDNAIHFYTKAIHLYDKDPFYHSNLALCYLRKERYNDCISECNAALKLNPTLSKAFFRRAQAYECLSENQSAIEDMMRVIELEPNIISHKRDLDRLQKRLNSDSIERGASKQLEKRVWLSLTKNQKYINFIHKAPHYRSKQPLKRLKIEEVQPSIPASVNDSGEKIPDAIIDKLFNNNTGECTSEPLPSRHTLDFGTFYRRRPKSPQKPEINDDIDDDQLQTPTSGMQFWQTWKELSNPKRFIYLKKLSDKPLNKILGASLDSEMLTDIIRVLCDAFVKNNLSVDHILRELGANDQTHLLSLFFSTEEKQNISKLINYMKSKGVDEAIVDDIKVKFNLN